jgi:hypothetical protein
MTAGVANWFFAAYIITRVDEERRHIQWTIESFQRTTGQRPVGWYCRYGPSVNTRELLVEEGGFVYDSDAYNDDLPTRRPTASGTSSPHPDLNDGRYVLP